MEYRKFLDDYWRNKLSFAGTGLGMMVSIGYLASNAPHKWYLNLGYGVGYAFIVAGSMLAGGFLGRAAGKFIDRRCG